MGRTTQSSARRDRGLRDRIGRSGKNLADQLRRRRLRCSATRAMDRWRQLLGSRPRDHRPLRSQPADRRRAVAARFRHRARRRRSCSAASSSTSTTPGEPASCCPATRSPASGADLIVSPIRSCATLEGSGPSRGRGVEAGWAAVTGSLWGLTPGGPDSSLPRLHHISSRAGCHGNGQNRSLG